MSFSFSKHSVFFGFSAAFLPAYRRLRIVPQKLVERCRRLERRAGFQRNQLVFSKRILKWQQQGNTLARVLSTTARSLAVVCPSAPRTMWLEFVVPSETISTHPGTLLLKAPMLFSSGTSSPLKRATLSPTHHTTSSCL